VRQTALDFGMLLIGQLHKRISSDWLENSDWPGKQNCSTFDKLTKIFNIASLKLPLTIPTKGQFTNNLQTTIYKLKVIINIVLTPQTEDI